MDIQHVIHRDADATTGEDACAGCARALRPGWGFAFKRKPARTGEENQGKAADLTKCLLCALRHLPMLKRSLVASLIVGSVLTALNQGDILLSGHWNSALHWKIPLTYSMPFLVSTYGALVNNRK